MSELRAAQAQPDACALICAVKDADADEVARIIAHCDKDAVLVVLAAMVPDDMPAVPLDRMPLSWYAREVCEHLGVELNDVLSESREERTTRARHVLCYVAKCLGFNLSEIGRHIGRDHSTVLHAVRKVDGDPRLATMARIVLDALEEPAA